MKKIYGNGGGGGVTAGQIARAGRTAAGRRNLANRGGVGGRRLTSRNVGAFLQRSARAEARRRGEIGRR